MTDEGLCTACSATQYCAEHEPSPAQRPAPRADEGLRQIEQVARELEQHAADLRALSAGHNHNAQHAAFAMDRFAARIRTAAAALRPSPSLASPSLEGLREKAEALVQALDACMPAIDGAFKLNAIRGANYTGPTFGRELEALRAALAARPSE